MVPPPPPSASYLWKFDDIDTDDDDSEDDYMIDHNDHQSQRTKEHLIESSSNVATTKDPVGRNRSPTKQDILPTSTSSINGSRIASRCPASVVQQEQILPLHRLELNNSSNCASTVEDDLSNKKSSCDIILTDSHDDDEERIDESKEGTATTAKRKKNKKKKKKKKSTKVMDTIDTAEDTTSSISIHTTDTSGIPPTPILDVSSCSSTSESSPSRSPSSSPLIVKKARSNSSSPITSSTTTSFRTSTKATALKTNTLQKKKNRSVTFTNVAIYTFQRCMGLHVVPTHGGWPLGMEYYHHEYTQHTEDEHSEAAATATTTTVTTAVPPPSMTVSVDLYESEKYNRLLQRYNTYHNITDNTDGKQEVQNSSENGIKHKHNNRKNTKTKKSDAPSSSLLKLETRQWDYKIKNHKNPLFTSLQEADRMTLLLQAEKAATLLLVGTISEPITEASSNKKSSTTTTSKITTRKRSGSVSNTNNSHDITTSVSSSPASIYTTSYVNSVRNALEQIRIDRSTGISCNCRKLHVPLVVSPSSLSTSTADGNKKSNQNNHHHNNNKRMKLQKLRDELNKRNVSYDESVMSREDMELLLYNTVQNEPCCSYSDSCFCARNGINCQADICSCWHTSHQSASASSSTAAGNNTNSNNNLSVQEIRKRCGNHVNGSGIYVVDDHAIDTFRTNYLQQLTSCPFITTTATATTNIVD